MKTCKQCSASFEILPEDRTFYGKMGVPEPQLCPPCRMQRRMSFRNHRKLYRRKCDLTGEEIISLYSPDKSYKVYKEEAWWGDQWDAMEYGRDFDFSRPFFEQFDELMHDVPRRGMHQDGTNEKCEYTTFGFSNKNGYLLYGCFLCEDVYYSTMSGMLKDSMDGFVCVEGSLLYECVDCTKCYECFFCHRCKNCFGSLLLEDCKSCQHCIGCKNLRNKEYHIYNKPVSKEEFEAFRKKLLEGDLAEERIKFNEWKLTFPHRAAQIDDSENCTGNYIEHAKNCHHCFDALMGAEGFRYCQMTGWKGKDMVDCTMGGKEAELLYEMHATIDSHRCAFTSFCRGGSDIYYCDGITSSEHCFGCSGLNHKKYCIFNKQYNKEEYQDMKARIIDHMKKTDEWGEFPPSSISPFGYNETFAHEHFPLSREEALAKEFKWSDFESPPPEVSKIIPAVKLPASIADVPDDILNWAIECEVTKKPFKLIPQELKFYRKLGLPLPRRHPDQRHLDRFNTRNPYQLWDRQCAKCGSAIQTSYSPERPELVYCEMCYMKEVY